MPPCTRPATRPLSHPLLLEPLEPRTLFSIVLTHAAPFSPVRLPSPVAVSSTVAPLFLGTAINAFSNQSFTAVVGTIKNLPPLLPGYTLSAQISWGDPSSLTTPATFVHNPDGSISILGSYLYTAPSAASSIYKILINIAALPPGNTLAPVRLLGSIQSTATVSFTNSGRTLNPTIHTPFTSTLATFHATASSNTMTATIDWGDGTSSTGKILALPSADPAASPIAGGLFAVSGSHTYSSLGSYLIKITLTSPVFPPSPTPAPTPAPTPPIILVSQLTSIADVLPLLATAL